jgi:hypothetical protein
MTKAASQLLLPRLTRVRPSNHPLVLRAGQVFDGGAPAHPGGWPADYDPWGALLFLGGEAEGQAALRAAVRERAERGCDVVKVMVSPPHPAIAQRTTAIIANHSRMFRAGATMIPGTDAGVSPGKPHDVLPYALQVLVDRIGMTRPRPCARPRPSPRTRSGWQEPRAR